MIGNMRHLFFFFKDSKILLVWICVNELHLHILIKTDNLTRHVDMLTPSWVYPSAHDTETC